MSTELPKQYDPQAAQTRWSAFWEQNGYFNADPGQVGPDGQPKPSHTIMIPLPNVTGALHMGHALNGTVQDLITRWRRMQGYEALWMPGTDHAGIATQSIVEKRMLEEEGFTRHTIPTKEGQTQRQALVERIWNWKDVYEARILSQQKQLGASCDWRRTRFTLDEVCSKAVRRTFFKMFQDGLIYRGKRLVNWDPFLQTAVADDEVYDEEIDGHFWTFNYPVEEGLSVEREALSEGVAADAQPSTLNAQRISFSTTRPETMLGDTAVCVHPTDERYKHLIGKHVRIPLNGRLIPIIADGLLADKELGTGCVKVTPAHDPNDYACYQRKLGQPDEIGIINILNPNGTVNANGDQWEGLDRYEARKAVVAEMEKLGHFEKVEDRKIPMKHSDRSKTPIEPYLSEQWFVKMGPHLLPDGSEVDLAQSAINAVTQNKVRFYPSRYAKTYLDWLGEKRDWCISRQLWWGHRIPIWTKTIDMKAFSNSILGQPTEGLLKDVIAARNLANAQHSNYVEKWIETGEQGNWRSLVCIDSGNDDLERYFESEGYVQDPDVLDTWFSSALWPHATLGWPDLEHDPPLDSKEVAKQVLATSPTLNAQRSTLNQNTVLSTFYPGSVLVTSRDIITLWVARMVLTGLYNMGDVPFKHVCVHPKILDGFGQGMSKSKGNGVDPLELIDRYGCDGTRFTIASFAGETQDVRLPVSYECPHCQAAIPQLQEHLKFKPGKPTVKCPKCKKESQYAQPWYTPDAGQPVARIIIERFEYGRNFCNKLWNAARFAIMNLEGYTPAEVTADQLQLEDRWILSRLASVAKEMDEYLSRYQLDAATRAIREFTWNEFCDWYLEMVKPRLRKAEGLRLKAEGSEAEGDQTPAVSGQPEETRAVAQRVLLMVLDSLVRLLQPFTPFICEELWSRLNEIAPNRALPPRSEAPPSPNLQPSAFSLQPRAAEPAAIIAQWPAFPAAWRDEALERRFARLQETIIAVRNVRAVYNIPPSTQLQLMIRSSPEVAGDMQNVAGQFDNLAKSVLAAAGADVVRPPASASFSLGDADGFVPLEGVIDRKSELDRQQKEADKLRKLIAGSEAKLNNESFVSKAPGHIVDGIKETLAGLQKQLTNAEEIIRDLS